MAKAKKAKGRKAKAARRRVKPRAKKASRRSAPAGGGSKRIAQLEAENRRLREELASLRAERGEVTSETEPGERTPALDL